MNSTDQPAKPQTRQTNPFQPPEELEPTASNPFEPPRKQKPPRATLSSLMTPTLVTNFDPTFKHPTRNFAPKSSRAAAERHSSPAWAARATAYHEKTECSPRRVQRLVRHGPYAASGTSDNQGTSAANSNCATGSSEKPSASNAGFE